MRRRFALDGSAYEIDLSTKHAKALRRKLEPFTSRKYSEIV